MSEETPAGREPTAEEIFEQEAESWKRTSVRVPNDILQRWLAMLRQRGNRKKVLREMQKWAWRNPTARVIRPCGCRLCNPGWGSN
uniref:Probable Vpr-like protein n=1 Tax=Caprine arthritis encephalitis virus TaxID=11660 RepID=Q9DKV6_CAEV|nr:tat protein [Caprine arthritis encephalitis virus]